ncbi:MAG: hypothetical protein M5U01_32035 [Ardenticatenaceae bacterium]|nr:hypothetical protein [Ardenticatenaceae bacterium]
MGYVATQQHPPVYEATTTITPGEFFQATDLSKANLLAGEVLARTDADIAFPPFLKSKTG